MPGATQYYVISALSHGGEKDFGFTYQSEAELEMGRLVKIPLRRDMSVGVVLAEVSQPKFATKPVAEMIDLILPPHLIALAEWLHDYYQASPKAVWQTILPTGILKKRRPPKTEKTIFSLPKTNHALTPKQVEALALMRKFEHKPILLFGITGSGKTQLYIERTREVLESGRSVILLVPEITLTPQLVAIFIATFGDIVITNHSAMSESDRHRAWLKAYGSDTPRIVIGPRSSLFLPFANLGLIIIDEAHETSYKQEQSPRYQTDSVAAKLAHLANASLILGSATPSLSQYYLARVGKLEQIELLERANNQLLPKTTIVDLRDPQVRLSNQFISKPLLAALADTLVSGRQSLLFINRRGSASSQICSDCGTVSDCPNCQLPMTFHADYVRLICHYCGARRLPPAVCPNCHSTNLRYLGGGTKRIEAEVTKLLPTARLARLDRDSATPQLIDDVYKGLHDRSIDILIGTQMVAKGLDIANLDLVGIVSADTMLHVPDYTASERTFSLLTQVSGRAGRGDRPGNVIIQSYTPNHPAIVKAATQDYRNFADIELEDRALLAYPPYVFLLKLTCAAPSSAQAQQTAQNKKLQLSQTPGIIVLGPAPAFIEKNRNRYYWHLIIKSKSRSRLVELVKDTTPDWTIDLDPINLL
ncbi:MAG: primosomal protein N' [Candidatus Saccharimonadia bacterium]